MSLIPIPTSTGAMRDLRRTHVTADTNTASLTQGTWFVTFTFVAYDAIINFEAKILSSSSSVLYTQNGSMPTGVDVVDGGYPYSFAGIILLPSPTTITVGLYTTGTTSMAAMATCHLTCIRLSANSSPF